MRTVAQERARYGWLTTSAFADAIGVESEQVRAMIRDGWFKNDGEVPECIDVALQSAERREYRIHPAALKRFYRERAK